MRAGCFAETRVIELLNRRFVNFYYNTGGPGLGKDRAAAAFTKGKTKNVYAFYAAFTAAGEPLGVTDVYADKDNTFDFLVALLRANPDLDEYTAEEQKVLDAANRAGATASARLKAGRVLEELGRYAAAEKHYRAVVEKAAVGPVLADAYRGLLRTARYGRKWGHAERWARHAEGKADQGRLGLRADLVMERCFRLQADGKHAEARKRLEVAIRAYPDSKRMSEMRFTAGVASFFLKDKERAWYHWCWVVENLPDDRLARRCFIAAAHEGMPYENPELGGYQARLRGGNIQVIQGAYERARRAYQRVKDRE